MARNLSWIERKKLLDELKYTDPTATVIEDEKGNKVSTKSKSLVTRDVNDLALVRDDILTQKDFRTKFDTQFKTNMPLLKLESKPEDRSGVFAKGAFRDGYQLGDITKSTVSTIGDVAGGLLKGAAQMGEGIYDAGMYFSAGLAENKGDTKLAEERRKKAQKESVNEFFEPYEMAVDKNSLLGEKTDLVTNALGQVGGLIGVGALAAAGAGALGIGAAGAGAVATALTTGTVFTSSTGSGMSEAYAGGATDKEAQQYGLIAGFADAATELLFGGLGKTVKAVGLSKGLSSADDILAKKISEKISNTVLKNATQLGVKASGEGLEEVLAGAIQAVGQQMTYRSEDDLKQIIEDQDLLEQFIVGAITSGIVQTPSAVKSSKAGRDFITGYTDNEQSVIDSELSKRMEESQAEMDSKAKEEAIKAEIDKEIARNEAELGTLTEDAKKSIEESVMARADEIEFTQSKLSKKDIAKIEEQVKKDLKSGEISIDTIEDALVGNERAQIKALNEELKTTVDPEQKADIEARIRELETSKNNTMMSMLQKDNLLQNSYREENLRHQAFTYEAKETDSDAKKELAKEFSAKERDNSTKTHNLFEYISKLQDDKGVKFGLTSAKDIDKLNISEEQKELRKKANGYVIYKDGKVDKIVLNTDSKTAVEFTVGHEITHLLEGTEEYKTLQDALKKYATTKGEYDTRLNEIKNLYNGVEGANVENELTSDLVGTYIFNDTDFVNNLSVENPSIFKRIYEEIKHLYKMATAGSTEARQLEKAKKSFEKAYRQNIKANENADVKYHISETFSNEIDKTLNGEMDKSSQVKARDYTPKILVENGVKDLPMLITQRHIKTIVYSEAEAQQLGLKTGDKYHYHGLGKDALIKSIDNMDNPSAIYKQDNSHYLIITEIKNNNGESVVVPVKIDGKGSYNDVYIDENQILSVYGKNNLESYLKRNNFEKIYEKKETALNERVKFPDISSLSQPEKQAASENNITSVEKDVKYSITDNKGRELSKEQQEYFKDSKVKDENGNLIRLYHGTTEEAFTTFDLRYSENGIFLTDDKDVASGYSGTNFEYAPFNIKTVEQANEYLKYHSVDGYHFEENNGQYQFFYNDSSEPEIESTSLEDVVTQSEDYTEIQYNDRNYTVYANVVNPLVIDANSSDWESIKFEGKEYTTNEISAIAKERGYDGVIIKNVLDKGFYKPNSQGKLATDVIVFNPNQIKSVNNTNPTDNPDIRFSFSKDNGVKIDEKSNSAIMYSLSYAPKTDAEVNKAAEDLQRQLGVSKEQAKKWIDNELSVASVILNPKYNEELDYKGDDQYEAIKKNSDYPQGTVDFSNICRKRREYTAVMDKVQRSFPEYVFTAEDMATVRQIMIDNDMEVACGICYVEDRRQNLGSIAQQFVDAVNKKDIKLNNKQKKALGELTDSYVPNIYELTTREGMETLENNHPEVAQAFKKFNNARGMASGRLLEGEAEYKRQILDYSDKRVKEINDNGGLRIYSFSDFEEIHLIDVIQVIQDCARKGIKIQGYTKVPSFAKLLENTGVKLNRSLIAKGNLGYHMEDGKVVLDYDTVEGININDPDFFDSTNNANIGNILVGINDTQIRAAMTDSFVDYIIPYHTNQKKSVLEIKGLNEWDNFKDSQTDKSLETGKTADKQVNIYTDVLNAAESEGNPITNKVEFVNKFLQVCKEKGLKPRFAQFLNTNANGDYVYTEGYHKFLIDFKLFDSTTGEILPQNEVVPEFDSEYMTNLLKNYVESQKEDNIAKDKKFNKVYKEIVDKVVNSNKHSLSNSNIKGTRWKDIAIKKPNQVVNNDIAPVKAQESVQPTLQTDNTDYAPLNEKDIARLEREQYESFVNMTDADEPAPKPDSSPDPIYAPDSLPVESPLKGRDWIDVGKRNVKAYQYEHPEVRPYFQEAAAGMYYDLMNSVKGERLYIDTSKESYNPDYTNGYLQVKGVKRQTTDDIADLLDSGYSYADIQKGLDAIIEDNGAENIAVAKRIEFALDERLRKGYKDVYGQPVPADQDYIQLLRDKEVTEYNNSIPIDESLMPPEDTSDNIAYLPKEERRKKHIEAYYKNKEADRVNSLTDADAPVPYVRGQANENAAPVQNETVETEDIPTKTRKELRKALIEDKTNGEWFKNALDNAKNLAMFKLNNTDTIRVTERVFGRENGRKINDIIFQKAIDNEADSIKWQNTQRDKVRALKIKAGTKESAAVQKYGEKQWVDENGDVKPYGDAELAREFPDAVQRRNIINAAKEIRNLYDEYIDTANGVLTKLGFDPIPKRADYMRHFQELNDAFSRFGIPFNAKALDEHTLPTDINGITDTFTPQKNYFASLRPRMGVKTDYDAIKGVDGYIGGIANLIFHTEDIQRGRAFEDLIRETYGEDKGWDNLENLPKEEQQRRAEQIQSNHLSNYVAWLHEWTNNVAGKKSKVDRSIESMFGRKAFAVLDEARKQVGSNMIGFNLSSALTNFIAPVQAAAKTSKLALAKGTADTVLNIFQKDDFASKNKFLTSRMGSDMLAQTNWQKIQNAGFIFMKGADWFTSNQIVRSKYYELRSKGMSEAQAHDEAGRFAARIMGDRTKGANAQLYNSKMLGMITQFQLEVNNQLYSMFYDTYHESKEAAQGNAAKAAAKMVFTLGQLAAYSHVFNMTFEAIAGYQPALDVIAMIAAAFGLDDDEESEDTVKENLQQAAKKLVDGLPYVNILSGGGRIPVTQGIPNLVKVATGGKDDYGNEVTLKDELKKLPYLLLPTGGNQIKKTYQGLSMFDEDLPVKGSYTDSGNLRFPIEDTVGNRIQASLFGQWANSNARQYFDTKQKPLQEKQIEEFAELDMPIADYWKYRKGLSEQDTIADKFDYVNSLDVTTEQKNIMINNIVDREKSIDMSNYDDFGSYEEFDYAIKNPEKYEFFKENGISYRDYAASTESKEAYNWAFNNPDKYEVSKAVTNDYMTYRQYYKDLNDLTADKDENGKSISGSRKEKVINYVDSLDIDYGAKLILYKTEYENDKSVNSEIINYLNSREDIDYNEMVTILEGLGMKVDANGNVTQ